MEEVKRRRGRPRKVIQLPEEIQKILDEVKEKED
jgi:predicted transcriptional regulator